MKKFIEGGLCGLLNGFFGSGGGVIAVPVLEREGCDEKQAHATSVALIFVLSLVTAIFYGFDGGLNFGAAWQYIPFGAAGALVGALFLRKIKALWLKKLFGALIIAAALRALFA